MQAMQLRAALGKQLLALSQVSAGVLQACMGTLLLLQRASHAAAAFNDPCLPIKDKYRDAAVHSVSMLPPLAGVPAMGA